MVSKIFRVLCGLAVTGGAWFGLMSPGLSQGNRTSDIAMWKIQSPQNTVYLLGSIHVGKSCELDSPKISTAMDDAENTVFEIDFTQVTPADQVELGLKLSQAGQLRPGDRTLKESVSADTYEQIRQKFEELKPSSLSLTLDTVNNIYRPTFIAFQMQGFQALKLGFSGTCGMDQLLVKQAQAENKKILALETFETQTELLQTLLTSLPEKDPEVEFQRLLSDIDTEQINGLLISVMTGDIETVQAKVNESCQSTPKLCYQVLDARNIIWLDQIKAYLQDQEDYLIVVGAAHMTGPNSLIKLLEGEDYRVEQF